MVLNNTYTPIMWGMMDVTAVRGLRAQRAYVPLATFHLLRSEFISPALSKVPLRVVTEVVSHDPKPVPAHLYALWNVFSSVVTLATSHAPRSIFTSPAK